jgi:hypothetical protein
LSSRVNSMIPYLQFHISVNGNWKQRSFSEWFQVLCQGKGNGNGNIMDVIYSCVYDWGYCTA